MSRTKIIIALFLIALLALYFIPTGRSETELYYAYAICNPKSNVYIRAFPKFSADIIAILDVGDEMRTDKKKRNGNWLHVYYPCEAGEGWVYAGYVVYDEPYVYKDGIDAETVRGKVNARRNIGGKIRSKLKKSARLTAYVVSDEWTVTNMGYIKTSFLSFGGGEDK